MKKCDFLIVGAGIIGLTVALKLKKYHPKAKILVLEKEHFLGAHASGRNSGVLHSGIYYSNDTLKAKMCARGSKSMMEFADEHGIKYKKTGKVIIASSENDLPVIDTLMKNALVNGVNAKQVSEEEIKLIEPNSLPYKTGIYTPDTAVIDSRRVLEKLYEILLDNNVEFIFNANLNSQNISRDTVHIASNEISYGYLFNCAGAHADKVAKQFDMATDYTLVPFKGIYYKLKENKNFILNGNIYPVPDPNLPFLCVHLTKNIHDEIFIGPTAIPSLGREHYGLISGIKIREGIDVGLQLIKMYFKNNNNFRILSHTELSKYFKPKFFNSVKKIASNINSNDIYLSNKVGIRPQLVNIKKNSLEMDFIIERTRKTTHVLNSISPAFTSSFAFADLIVKEII